MAKVPPFDLSERVTPDVRRGFETLQQLLVTLSPMDNFKGFLWSGTVPTSTEIKIPHKLGVVPSGYLIIFCQNGTVQAGPTDWTKTHVYLLNLNALLPAIARAFFFV